MPLLTRAELSRNLPAIINEGPLPLILFFGERYLCQTSADELQQALLNTRAGTVTPIDGDQEDTVQTLQKLLTFSLLPGLQLYRVNDTRLFLSKTTSQAIWKKAASANDSGNTTQAAKYLGQFCQSAGITPDEAFPLSGLNSKAWKEYFDFAKPQDCTWADQLGKNIPATPAVRGNSDIADRYMEAFQKGIPADNTLILIAENVDKRKRLFTFVKEHGLVIDCSVASGSSTAALNSQKEILREMIRKTLAEFGKKLDNRALDLLFDRIGFHPVAVVMETEKLALYCEEREQITPEDINTIVGRSREDALFELTDQLGKRNVRGALVTLHHLQENGIHALAVLATLRNYTRRLLTFRSFQQRQSPAYRRGMNAQHFQRSYLPELREEVPEWKETLGGHPYAVFKSFETASAYPPSLLKNWLNLILKAEFQLKGAGIEEHIILENLLITMMKKRETET